VLSEVMPPRTPEPLLSYVAVKTSTEWNQRPRLLSKPVPNQGLAAG
jgi:hypothetical protein